jgi:hypothetical protein
LDPHGDLGDTIVSIVPRHRTHDVVVLDVSDRPYPLREMSRRRYARPLQMVEAEISKLFLPALAR